MRRTHPPLLYLLFSLVFLLALLSDSVAEEQVLAERKYASVVRSSFSPQDERDGRFLRRAEELENDNGNGAGSEGSGEGEGEPGDVEDEHDELKEDEDLDIIEDEDVDEGDSERETTTTPLPTRPSDNDIDSVDGTTVGTSSPTSTYAEQAEHEEKCDDTRGDDVFVDKIERVQGTNWVNVYFGAPAVDLRNFRVQVEKSDRYYVEVPEKNKPSRPSLSTILAAGKSDFVAFRFEEGFTPLSESCVDLTVLVSYSWKNSCKETVHVKRKPLKLAAGDIDSCHPLCDTSVQPQLRFIKGKEGVRIQNIREIFAAQWVETSITSDMDIDNVKIYVKSANGQKIDYPGDLKFAQLTTGGSELLTQREDSFVWAPTTGEECDEYTIQVKLRYRICKETKRATIELPALALHQFPHESPSFDLTSAMVNKDTKWVDLEFKGLYQTQFKRVAVVIFNKALKVKYPSGKSSTNLASDSVLDANEVDHASFALELKENGSLSSSSGQIALQAQIWTACGISEFPFVLSVSDLEGIIDTKGNESRQ